MQQKAFIKLLGLQYKVVYKKGVLNRAADALSRQEHNIELEAIPVSKPKWKEVIIEGYHQDEVAKVLLTELSITGYNDRGYALMDGIIKYRGRGWLGNHVEPHQAIMLAVHTSGLGEKYEITTTYNKIKALFDW